MLGDRGVLDKSLEDTGKQLLKSSSNKAWSWMLKPGFPSAPVGCAALPQDVKQPHQRRDEFAKHAPEGPKQ